MADVISEVAEKVEVVGQVADERILSPGNSLEARNQALGNFTLVGPVSYFLYRYSFFFHCIFWYESSKWFSPTAGLLLNHQSYNRLHPLFFTFFQTRYRSM